MTYNEWRDELKSNLLCVSEREMMRVLDYYAEAYADRRDAGYSEREITAEFGAPYDAAQRILAESAAEYPTEVVDLGERRKAQVKPQNRPQPQQRRQSKTQEQDSGDVQPAYTPTQPQQPYQNAQAKSPDRTWAFVLLCIIFAIPLFGFIMAMVGVTIGIGAAPFALIVAGAGSIVQGVVEIFSDVALGAVTIGIGLVFLGLGLILAPILFKVVKLLWKLFAKFFMWVKSLFSGKERE